MLNSSKERQLNEKVFILIFGLFFKLCDVRCDTILSTECNNKQIFPCFHPISICNKRRGVCQCNDRFPLDMSALGTCLDKREFGSDCIYSSQCSSINNTVCLNAEEVELNIIDLIDDQLLSEYYSKTFTPIHLIRSRRKKNRYKSLGQCKCRPGYKLDDSGKCHILQLNNLVCFSSHQCLVMDMNSRCDAKSNRCHCNSGYVYNTDKNKCQMSSRKFNHYCKHDIECQSWNSNFECRDVNGQRRCACRQSFNFDQTLQKCIPFAKFNSKTCSYGFIWNEKSGDCEALPLYDVRERTTEYRIFSADKLLETIVIVIFCCVTIAILRFWRNILPQHLHNDSRTGIPSDFSHSNRIHRRRSSRNNSLSRSGGRVIQLRVNLDSPDSQFFPERVVVDLPLTASHSSLPPYESYESVGNSTPANSSQPQPPPYTDEPPTYEEAMALTELIKK